MLMHFTVSDQNFFVFLQNGKLLYKVRWVSYTWVPEEYLVSFPDLVKAFWLEKQEGEVSPTEDRAIYLEQPCNDQQLDVQSRQDGENQIQEVWPFRFELRF